MNNQDHLVTIGKDDFVSLLRSSGISPSQLPPIFDVDGNRISLHEPASRIGRLYTVKEVEQIFHVSRDTLRLWNKSGRLPRFRLPGTNRVYYRENTILQCLKS